MRRQAHTLYLPSENVWVVVDTKGETYVARYQTEQDALDALNQITCGEKKPDSDLAKSPKPLAQRRKPKAKTIYRALMDKPYPEGEKRYEILMHLDKGAVEIGKALELAQMTVPDTLLVAALAILSKTADDLCADMMEGKR